MTTPTARRSCCTRLAVLLRRRQGGRPEVSSRSKLAHRREEWRVQHEFLIVSLDKSLSNRSAKMTNSVSLEQSLLSWYKSVKTSVIPKNYSLFRTSESNRVSFLCLDQRCGLTAAKAQSLYAIGALFFSEIGKCSPSRLETESNPHVANRL